MLFMKQKVRYRDMAMGFGGFVVALLLAIIILGIVNSFGPLMLPLFVFPLALMTAADDRVVDIEKGVYRQSTVFLGFISFQKWEEINERCFLKIEPLSRTTSMGIGAVQSTVGPL